MSGIRFIKAKNSDSDILKIQKVEMYENIAGFDGKNAIKIFVSKNFYTYEQVKAYFDNNDISTLELRMYIAVAPEGYQANEKSVLCDTYINYTKERDISYDNNEKMFTVTLQQETAASLQAKACKAQSLEAQASLVELLEGGII